MLSKSQISFIKSLHHKKFRKETQLFLVEGIKSVVEFLNSPYKIKIVYYTADIDKKFLTLLMQNNISTDLISQQDLQRISALNSSTSVVAIIEMGIHTIDVAYLQGKYSLVVDGVQDPGNMGTIIRTADWFNIHQIICSENCVDVYNPKVVQASMGSLARIPITYTDLSVMLSQVASLPVYGALLHGQAVYETQFMEQGIILVGNEGNGISLNLQPYITQAITIPKFGKAESLNVAIATSIICSELRRPKG